MIADRAGQAVPTRLAGEPQQTGGGEQVQQHPDAAAQRPRVVGEHPGDQRQAVAAVTRAPITVPRSPSAT